MNRSLIRLVLWICALAGATVQQSYAQGTVVGAALDAMARPTTGLVGLTTTGALARSTDNGVNFTTVRAADAPRGLFAVAASGGTVIAMGDSGWFVRSTDNGATYGTFAPSVTPAFVGAINALAFANGKWVAVGYKNSVAALVTSATGLSGSWSAVTITGAPSGALRGIAWTGARWVSVGGGASAGYVFTSTDAVTWTKLANSAYPGGVAPATLNAVASDGAGKVLAVGKAGTMLYSSDGGLTYIDAADSIVSEDLRSVLFRTGTQWVVGGDSAALVNYDATLLGAGASLSYDPVPGSRSITAIVAGTTAGQYLYSSDYSSSAPTPGPISLLVGTVSNQLQLTLVGGVSGVSYYTETTADLVTWTPVSGSTLTSNGVSALTWTYALPGAGARVFYRAKSGSTP
jgi:hypothetical protein